MTSQKPRLLDETTDQYCQTLLSSLSLEDKIGQMTQVESGTAQQLGSKLREFRVGSILSGGGGAPNSGNTAQDWLNMVTQLCSEAEAQQDSPTKIPCIYGVDAVHGHNNVYGATVFPHNIGLGATRDYELVKSIGEATATEVRATGIHWTFAPALSIPHDTRWGRTYEGFSQDPSIVSSLGLASIIGLQNPFSSSEDVPEHWPVIACAKHFVGDGGTGWNTSFHKTDYHKAWVIDRGDTICDEETLRSIHLTPYIPAIKNGNVLTVMASYSSWNGERLHGHKWLLTDVLKKELGFRGFVISDWKGIEYLSGDPLEQVVKSINAGIDMMMVPYDIEKFQKLVKQAIDQGLISMERIDDAVTRILRVKVSVGLFDGTWERDHKTPSLSLFGCSAHRKLARRAVQKSITILSDPSKLLPVNIQSSDILLVSGAADDIGRQCGGWTIEWQGKTGKSNLGTSILEGFNEVLSNSAKIIYSEDANFENKEIKAQYGIYVLAEDPYAEGVGDSKSIVPSDKVKEELQRMRNHCQKLITLIVSGRPLIITSLLEYSDAWVACWLPGSEGAGVADVLFGKVPITGKLPISWPREVKDLPLHKTKEAPLFAYQP